MQPWRFVVRLNRSLVELVGLVIEKTEVVYLKLWQNFRTAPYIIIHPYMGLYFSVYHQ